MSCFQNNVLTVMTILLSCANNIVPENVTEITENEYTEKILPASEDQVKFLAEEICENLAQIQKENVTFEAFNEDKCNRKFSSPKRNLTLHPSTLNFRCRAKDKATFSVAPSPNWQLAVLIPEDDEAYINYYIIEPFEESGSLFAEDSLNYTFWTTVLNNDGTPSIWVQGPRLPVVDGRQAIYNVSVEEPILEMDNATFKISFFGEINNCASVQIVHTCDKKNMGDIFTKTIAPTNQTVTIGGIPKNDNCNLSLFVGDKVVDKKRYSTIKTNVAEEPKKVYLDPEPNGDSWDVYVRWEKPKVQTEKFNVTLRAPGVFRTEIFAANITYMVFKEVPGEAGEYFNVSIQSFLGNMGSPLAISRAQFPEYRDYQAVILTGSWTVVLAVAAAALGFVMWLRRRRARALTNLYFPEEPDFKLSKECSLEIPEPGGAEDCWELRSERLLLHEVIGEGEFGVVRRGTLAPIGKDVAVKMLKEYPSPEEVRSFLAEMELMKSVGCHPHIVNLVGCCTERKPLIVAEYCSQGDLLSFLRFSWEMMVTKNNVKYTNNNIEPNDYRNDLLKKNNDKLTPLVVNKMYDFQGICDSELTSLDLLSFCRQIAMGMEFLASNRVVHRDLAARNILVTADRTLKITDFGLSRDVYQENHYKQKGNGKLPVKWMALESLTRGIYTSQSDVWSFGIVIWEIVTVGATPYPDVPASRIPKLLRTGYRMPRPNNCSQQLYDLMYSCWSVRPRDRPTFAGLHRSIDDLLNTASANEYLTLEVDYEPPPAPKPQGYFKLLFKGNRVWSKAENYERPLKSKHYSPPSNHYTSPPTPASIPKVQVV